FRSEYLGQLRQHALKRDVLQKLCVGDIVLVEDINKRPLLWPLAKIIEIFPVRDNVVRLAKVKTDNGIFLRPIQRLFPLEISQSKDDPLPGGDLLRKQAFQRQFASPVAGPERPSQDAASASSNVTRTGRVIKPPQRLDLFRSEYLGQLRQHALKRDVLQKLCVGDIVLVEDINKRPLLWPLAKIIEIFPVRDNVVRLAKVKTDNGIFLRPIQRLFPLEISQSKDDPLPGGDLLRKQAFQRQFASPVAGPERPSQDAASASSNVTRTGRVIKPPQRLDL
ncbi:DUF5641 domain-containing protein, partial [Nephila pilipes]